MGFAYHGQESVFGSLLGLGRTIGRTGGLNDHPELPCRSREISAGRPASGPNMVLESSRSSASES
jgi:hypothetical protein